MKVALLAAIYTVIWVNGQTLFPQVERGPMLETLAGLKVSFERCAARPELRESALKCLKNVEYFQTAANKWKPRRPRDGEGLLISLQAMLRVVENLPQSSAEAVRTLNDLADDLSDKQSVCWRAGLDAQPMVEVRPKKNGMTEAPGLEVWYVEKFLASDPTAKPHRFPGFSSPVRDELVPGRYLFWSAGPGGRNGVGAKTEQRVAARANKLVLPIRIEVLAP